MSLMLRILKVIDNIASLLLSLTRNWHINFDLQFVASLLLAAMCCSTSVIFSGFSAAVDYACG